MEHDKPAFECHVGDRIYKIWANGRTEGFEDGDKRVRMTDRV